MCLAVNAAEDDDNSESRNYEEAMQGIETNEWMLAMIEEKQIELAKISTHDNSADMLTKALSSAKFKFCLNLVGLYDAA